MLPLSYATEGLHRASLDKDLFPRALFLCHLHGGHILPLHDEMRSQGMNFVSPTSHYSLITVLIHF